jgi:hypothetical protein
VVVTVDVAKVKNLLAHTRDILARQQILWLDIAKWKALVTKKSLVAKEMLRNAKARRKKDVRRKIVAKSRMID